MWPLAKDVYLEGDATTGCFQGAIERLWDRIDPGPRIQAFTEEWISMLL